MTLEICAYSLTACRIAQRAGAGRVELCTGQGEGGLTPSPGLMQLARRHLTIPLYVMIRPRGGDFCYTDDEVAVMLADIDAARRAGADGVVLGCLRPDGTVDETMTRRFVAQAQPMGVTFHRAFDLTRDPYEALEAVIRTGAERLLTSGQQPSAEAGAPLLRALVDRAAGRLEIMAGAGVNSGNAPLLGQTGVTALHLSGSARSDSPMTYRPTTVPMASARPGDYERLETDEATVRAVLKALSTKNF